VSEIRDGFKDVLFDLAITDRAVHKTLADLLAVLDEHTETEYKIEHQVYRDRDVWRRRSDVFEARTAADAALDEADNGQGPVRMVSRRVSEWTPIEGGKT